MPLVLGKATGVEHPSAAGDDVNSGPDVVGLAIDLHDWLPPDVQGCPAVLADDAHTPRYPKTTIQQPVLVMNAAQGTC